MKNLLTSIFLVIGIATSALATTTVGDKIGFTGPSPGADTNTWGTSANAMFTQWDEFFYASREDRNIVIQGGGKISYDSATGQVSFTSAITVRNHITAFVNTITTAASPITLSASNKVAYVQVNRKPGADHNITSATVVSAGSLPNTITDADAGTIVLFMRTADNSLWIPWAKKELLSGDTWTAGIGPSWYERLATTGKPGFKSTASDTSQLTVSASTTTPAAVVIDGILYVNTADKTLDLDTSGRNGLDTGTKAANTVYYLYAIAPTSGRGFDIVCSTTGPGTGPTGFTSWSYLGGFRTWGSSALVVFTASGGVMSQAATSDDASPTLAAVTAFTLVIPTTAKTVTMRVLFSAVNAAGDLVAVGPSNTSTYTITTVRAASATAANDTPGFITIPINTAQTVYAEMTSNSDDSGLRVVGWRENPMEYK